MEQLLEELTQHLVRWHRMTDLEARVALSNAKGTVISSSPSPETGKVYIALSVGLPHKCTSECGKTV